ncbi:Uncharacterized protein BP5553_04718 [Venustampulla echinocandica]|uniref:Uncharacterized protein n=1 Tax=Venustampulla echinocandica TaxID=2656787 RepID=A0A370TP38_9HELO|nr:Uncharacterized protein BP5553_04718 [Venustampulla echinocandica]RDL37285.1 Uncharacterized protein BP5553_04718 [Venustampulla echinocandica]
MYISLSSSLLLLYVACETVRANYAYYAFHNFPQISASLIALLSECLKLFIAIFFLLRLHDGFSASGLKKCIRSIWQGEGDFNRILKYALPAALYLTNNLIYYTVLPKTSPSLLQVCVLAKLPTTGILHHYMIKPQRNVYAWFSLLFLCVGLVVFNIPSRPQNDASTDAGTAWYLAPVAGFVIACLSGLASISTETSTKVGKFWESQAYLYIWGMVFAIIAYPLAPSGGNMQINTEAPKPFLVGSAVLGLVVMTSGTGLVVAVVLRARDNILKLVGTAASLITIAASQYVLLPDLRASTFTSWKVCGGGIVTISTWCYNYYSQQEWPQSTATQERDLESETLLAEGEEEPVEKSSSVEKFEAVEGSTEVALLQPTAQKIICSLISVAYVTYEVALRTN